MLACRLARVVPAVGMSPPLLRGRTARGRMTAIGCVAMLPTSVVALHMAALPHSVFFQTNGARLAASCGLLNWLCRVSTRQPGRLAEAALSSVLTTRPSSS
jgi:hypothetical protein